MSGRGHGPAQGVRLSRAPGGRDYALRARSVVVTDPGFRASRQVALGCQEAGLRFRYITSFYYDHDSLYSRVLRHLPGAWHHAAEGVLARRHLEGLDACRVRSIPFPELGARLGQKLVPRRVAPAGYRLTHWKERQFDCLAANSLPADFAVVYANEGAAERTFKATAHTGATKVLEGTQHPEYLSTILAGEYARLGIPMDRASFRVEALMREMDLADFVVTQSQFSAGTYIRAGVPASKVVVAPLGVDLEVFRPGNAQHRTPVGPLQLLYVGQISVRKGVARLLEAILGIPDLDLELTLIGSADLEMQPTLRSLLCAAGPRARRLQPMGRRDLASYYRQADVLLLPTLCDSFGQVVLEAMACATPVIVTDACGAPVRNEIDGLVVPASDTKALIQSIVRCSGDREWLATLGLNARQRAAEFPWDRFRRFMADLLGALATGKHPPT